MKKILAILPCALLALAACTKTEMPTGNTVSAELEIAVPDAAVKSIIDGAGKHVNRCVVEVQYVGATATTRYKRLEVAVVDGKANAKVDLVAGQTYNFLFFADSAAVNAGVYSDLYYDTQSGLEAVKVIAGKEGDDDARDAFSAALADKLIEDGGLKTTATLTRPLAQVRIITTDIEAIKGTDMADAMMPKTVKVTYKGADTFDVLTGEASGEAEYSFDKAVYDPDKDRYILSMDYVLAPSERKSISAIDMDVTLQNDAHVKGKFENIPFERNWRTNIIGALFTTVGDFSIVVDPNWTGEIDF